MTMAIGRTAGPSPLPIRPGRRTVGEAWLVLPAAGFAAVALILPLVLLLLRSFGDGVTLAEYTGFFASGYSWGTIGNTLGYGGVVTAIALAVGLPYAFALARANGAVEIALLVGMFLPMTASVIVKAFGWTILLRRNGIVNDGLMLLGLVDEPLSLLFSPAGLFLGTASILLPYMVLPIYGALRMLGPELAEAAATLGARPTAVLGRVVLPLALPGIVSGMSFVFSMTVSAYVIPGLLIGAGYPVLSHVVAMAFLVTDDQERGAAVSVLLLVLAGGIVWAGNALAQRLDAGR